MCSPQLGTGCEATFCRWRSDLASGQKIDQSLSVASWPISAKSWPPSARHRHSSAAQDTLRPPETVLSVRKEKTRAQRAELCKCTSARRSSSRFALRTGLCLCSFRHSSGAVLCTFRRSFSCKLAHKVGHFPPTSRETVFGARWAQLLASLPPNPLSPASPKVLRKLGRTSASLQCRQSLVQTVCREDSL